MPEDYIIKQGQKATCVYFLAQGQCEVLVKDHSKKETFVKELNPGCMFGEVALLFNTKRTASVKSKNHCLVGGLSEDNFMELRGLYPELDITLKGETHCYRDTWKTAQIKMLGAVDYLQGVDFEIKELLHYHLTLEHFENQAKIFQRGTPCQKVFFIAGG